MGLKPDHWIRKMARERGMIEPFADSQVRNGVISYGVSSYGYDIRVADEFKIFTNVYSAIVDPKHFDPQSMVDFKGDVCVIPPNSFALARTIEYFRIPRNVLTVCLGKCLTGDTRVVDAASGNFLPIREFVARQSPSTVALEKGTLRRKAVRAHLDQGVKPVYALETAAGLTIKATRNHPFLTPHGWAPLETLQPGDQIALAGRCPVFGQSDWPESEAVQLGLALARGRRNPGGRLSALPGKEMEERSAPEIVFSAQRGALAAFLRGLFTGDGSVHFEAANGEEPFLEYASASRRLVEDLHHLLLRFGIFARIRREVFAPGHPLYRLQIAGPLDIRRFAQEIGFLPGSLKQTLLGELLSQLPAEAHRPGFQALRSPALKEPVLAGTTFRAPTSFSQPSYEPNLLNTVHAEEEELVWDGVVSIQPAGVEPVYDLTVPEASNFLANDLIVHNSTYARCGIIVNVTPFEPEWEGFVTLEISNTTPLPAKIYANEGIAQVLFFEGDEECETSYADKKGKYQGQQSIVLPKL